MSLIRDLFDERKAEVKLSLDFLRLIDSAIKNGNNQIGTISRKAIRPEQQKILYSCLYLQLYNLIECTITSCLDAISKIAYAENVKPSDLTQSLQKLWVQNIVKTHSDASKDTRLSKTMELFEYLCGKYPLPEWEIERGGGGNWCDDAIDNMLKRLDLRLKLSKRMYCAIKRPIKDNQKPLKAVMEIRNRLAHGSISFVSCSDTVTFREIKKLTIIILAYLEYLVSRFELFLSNKEYILK